MLEYTISAKSIAHEEASFSSDSFSYPFEIASNSTAVQTSPAELLLGAFSACVLKNVERFSEILKFEYENATVDVKGYRTDKPPTISLIEYKLKIKSADPKLNSHLLMKNIQKFGTIYNTLAKTAEINGTIEVV